MAETRYDSGTDVWGSNGSASTPPVKPKHQNVGCLAYFGLLTGVFWVLAGSYCFFMVAADMPGRGKMPPALEWVVVFTSLFVFGLLPLVLSVRSMLRTRRINKVNEANYRRAMAEYGQANPNLHEQYPWRY